MGEEWVPIKFNECYSICKIGEKGGKIRCEVTGKIVAEFTDYDIPRQVHIYFKFNDEDEIVRCESSTSVAAAYRHTFPEVEIDGEYWRIIPYHERYAASRDGKIYSLDRQRMVSLSLDSDGYLQFTDHCNGKRRTIKVHKAVALAFIPNDNPLEKISINHKNEDKTDNRVENLEWCTVGYNNTYGQRLENVRQSHLQTHFIERYLLAALFLSPLNMNQGEEIDPQFCPVPEENWVSPHSECWRGKYSDWKVYE